MFADKMQLVVLAKLYVQDSGLARSEVSFTAVKSSPDRRPNDCTWGLCLIYLSPISYLPQIQKS